MLKVLQRAFAHGLIDNDGKLAALLNRNPVQDKSEKTIPYS